MRMISDNIGWDGSSFFCRRCGKAGYTKMAQVRGHLAMCPGRAISKGAIPQPVSQPVSKPVGQPAATGLRAVATVPTATMSGLANQLQPVNQQQLGDRYGELDRRLGTLENEYNHLLVERNSPADDWLSRNKSTVILIAILAFGFVMMMRESQSCNGDGSGKSSKSPLSSLGEKALGQFVNRGVSKGVDSLFGK